MKIVNKMRNQTLNIDWGELGSQELQPRESVKIPEGANVDKNFYVQSYKEAGWIDIIVETPSKKASFKRKKIEEPIEALIEDSGGEE